MTRRLSTLWLLGAIACGSPADEASPAVDPDGAAPPIDASDVVPTIDAATLPGEPDAAALPGEPDAAALPGEPDAAALPGEPDAAPGEIVPLLINELMVKNRLSLLDDHERHADWVELYNPSAEDAPLDGWALTNDLAVPGKHELTAGLVVPAGGYLLLWVDGESSLGPAHVGFTLPIEGGELGLTRPDGTYADRVVYGTQAADVSAARTPDGSGLWQVVWEITPGAPNPLADGAPSPGPDPESIPAAGDLSDGLLGDDVMPELDLVLSAEAIDDLRAAPREWVPGELIFRGRRFAPVGVRLKGNNSFQPIDQKPSFKIKIDHYFHGAEVLGVDDLTLNNMDDDPSMMRERIAYRIARMTGVPASRANHAVVTVNGAPYGLYAQIETVERRLIERWFGDASGPLFEAGDVDFIEAYIELYDHEGGPDDRSALYALAAALTLPAPDAMAAAAEVLDLNLFHRYWAACAVIGQFDAFPYSDPGDDYLLYVDPITGRMAFLPWGMDETFNWSAGPVLDITSVLAQRCLEHSPCRDALIAQIWSVVDAIEAAELTTDIDLVAAEIAARVAADPRKPYTHAAVLDEQDNLRWFVSTRRDSLAAQLPAP